MAQRYSDLVLCHQHAIILIVTFGNPRLNYGMNKEFKDVNEQYNIKAYVHHFVVILQQLIEICFAGSTPEPTLILHLVIFHPTVQGC